MSRQFISQQKSNMNWTTPSVATSDEIFKEIASKTNFDLIGERRHLVNYPKLFPNNNIHHNNYHNINDTDHDSSKINTMLLLNSTGNESNAMPPNMDPLLMEQYLHNRAIESPWYHLLIAMYSVLIVFGAIGNIMVVIAVVRKPIMRTARNLFILNLAISDLLLCLVTMPLTLMEILSKFWPYGSCAILCKTIAMLQALSIFVSTISITAIAFDRYQVIVYPTRDCLQFVGAVTILAGIWILALVLASPLLIYKELINRDIPPVLHKFGVPHTISYCIEDWPLNEGRFYYSIFSLCVQYLVPILIVSVAYFGIYNKLKSRITVVAVQSSSQRKVERGRRMKRTNRLLISIAVIFGVSWLPLNFFNLYADMQHPSAVTQRMLVAYAICHMIGMSSACSNPLLYGWLNDNFRKEFQELLCRCTESTNVALPGHTTGSNVQAATSRRRRKNEANMLKGELQLLGNRGCVDVDGGVSIAATEFNTRQTINGTRSAVTESVVLTENPMPTEMTTLVPRLQQY
ncbi:neuropeptide F receptor isoform X1 [Drosophila sulfurigaster albostrigata]|uniref:neuropeptide F receptor isoform X1 n=2 Tax=Drosophila sulfurigaster albostrigata TaxID=89887 RepID=UPI002D21C856|nr:neuropeptide F receptor isoform X1 [Drosophila sulfurigaster albostrigata]